ncbi:MAG: AbrB/MazE/SpoVT family DNA-binding domain-containing protein [Lachnospiraceae bacterium]|nr:AbrB/MazE/SpoVT family DNA-binding domain-containing protein [Lachnospiraceae bacterium]
MQTQVKKWGNSQGIRIPKEILQEASIGENDILDIEVLNGKIILTKQFRHKTLEERVAAYGGKLNLDGEFDWGDPVGREKWY